MTTAAPVRIESVRLIDKPPEELCLGWREHYAYPSNNGAQIAWFSDEGEFRMGASSFALRVGSANASIGSLPKRIIQGYARELIAAQLLDYQPWTCDDTELVVLFWEKPPILFDPIQQTIRRLVPELPAGAFIRACLCSPRRSIAFTASARKDWMAPLDAFFLSMGEPVHIQRNFTIPNRSRAFWLTSGEQLLVLCQGDGTPIPQLQLHDAQNSGDPIAETSVDPQTSVPYDIERFKQIHRDHFALERNASTWAVGYLLDEWGQVGYLPADNKLVASIERPTGDPFRKQNQWMCPVETKWIEIQLAYSQ